MKRFWTLWSKALGEKAFEDDNESDKVALIRTAIILFYFTTNIFIISGIVRHWNGPSSFIDKVDCKVENEKERNTSPNPPSPITINTFLNR